MSTDSKIAPAQSRSDSLIEKGDVANVRVGNATQPVELVRRFSFLACLGLGFSLLNSWTGEYTLRPPCHQPI